MDPVDQTLRIGPGEYRNPILQGFYPDPSITRAGDDFYLVTSTFAYFPGIPVFRSRDLVNWTQIGNAIDRPDMLDFGRLGLSRGVFAPAIEHHDGLFYILNSCVDCGGNFVITARDPAGPWSDPVWLPQLEGGIDPSLFFDTDGKAYILNNGPPEGQPRYDGHRAIWIQEFDAARLRTVGPRRVLVDGGVDPASRPIWIEGPHIIKRGGHYYLICAEGGTAEGHSQVVLRADSPMGPYTPWSGNPILTQRDLPRDRPFPITSAGHADFVETPGGQWWATFLAVRPYEGDYYNTGRETFLMPVEWDEDGWPRITSPGQAIPYSHDRPALPPQPAPPVPTSGAFELRESFDGAVLAPHWMMVRNPQTRWHALADGALRVEARPIGLGERGNPSFLARRQQHLDASAETELRFRAEQDGDQAGLAAFQNDEHWYSIGIGRDGGRDVVELRRRTGPHEPAAGTAIAVAPLPVEPGAPLRLRIEAQGDRYRFAYAAGMGEWRPLGGDLDGRILSTRTAGGFVGAVFGLYAVSGDAQRGDRPAAIRLNQIGLLPDAPKRALLPNQSPTPLRWRLVDEAEHVRADGETVVIGPDAASGETLHLIDFSGFDGNGSGFRLEAGEARSRPFRIGADLYARLPFDALTYFYHNRAGTPIEARHAGGDRWARPAAHRPERATCFAGEDDSGQSWSGCDYRIDVTGGWYDAGDHGKYVVNGGIALWTLLNAYERSRLNGGASLFRDGSAAIPEAGNGVDDLLDEARWEMEFLLSMQVPEGTRLQLPVGPHRRGERLAFTQVDASGMAHHKVAGRQWTPMPSAPHLDREARYLYPPSTGATLNLAATAAQCARVWREVDPAFAARCLTAAERAFAAAMRNPEIHAGNFAGSGSYGDRSFTDEAYWAAAELLVTTGRDDYAQAVRRSPHFAGDVDAAGWASTATLGTISLALAPSALPDEERQGQRARLVAAADRFLAERGRIGYRIPYAPPYPWGSNAVLLNRAMILALANDFTGEARYRGAVVDAMDYLLGRNPLDRSYVSGYGARPMRHPHHRFWAHSLDPQLPPPPPGALSGGPNNGHPAEAVARAIQGCAPQACWRDDIGAFSLNEVAINWNAPLVWVAAWLAEAD